MTQSPPAAYPRPDFYRTGLTWKSLNGTWDFAFDDSDIGLLEKWYQTSLPATQKRAIIVPFAFQTVASGIHDRHAHEILWYERLVPDVRTPTERAEGYRLLLRFGAVDYEASIWGDGVLVGHHRGGHVPFEMDLSELCSEGVGDVRVTLRVRDSPDDLTQPRGKQFWGPEPESIFYTPTSGIWQSVWIESVPPTRLADGSGGTVFRFDDIEGGLLAAKIAVIGGKIGKGFVSAEARIGGVVVNSSRAELPPKKELVSLEVSMRLTSKQQRSLPEGLEWNLHDEVCWRDGVALWSPEHPLLYDLTLRLFDEEQLLDEVNTTTGMRSLSWTSGDGTITLNGKPYFQALVLDQGYWVDSGLTPPSPDSLKTDIELSKKMGFNGCRKHQKVEDPIFLYWADRLGFLVWGEMANAFDYSHEYVDRFNAEWLEAVKRDINHPCVVTWTPVNESWGYPSLRNNVEQRNHLRALYFMTKTLDPTRPVNDNCGWGHVCTDLTTFHEYADYSELTRICSSLPTILDSRRNPEMFVARIDKPIPDDGSEHKEGAPVICSEFGGLNIAPSNDMPAAGERDWGYITAKDTSDYLQRVENLIMGIVNGAQCCGFVYTQLTDIEQEVNGLYFFDRREKVPSAKVKEILDLAKKTYYDRLKM